jgi:Tfp pilus assembly protein PilO
MFREFKWRKRVILVGVTLLVLADVALAAYTWEISNAPQAPEKQVALYTMQRNLLKADIKRAQDIRDSIPATQKDCERFEQSLFPASSGGSAVRSELGAIARKKGVDLEDLSFKRTDIADRGITEVAIDAAVTGSYKNVIEFLNGLQRSPSLYAVDALTLSPENSSQKGPANGIKVALHLRTYFRTAA